MHTRTLSAGADQPLDEAADDCRSLGTAVETVQCDLAETDGVERLLAVAAQRPVDALLAHSRPAA